MKRWALVVVALFGLVAVILTPPVWRFSFPEKSPAASSPDPLEVYQAFLEPSYWIWIGILLLCQACLLLVPVRVASRKPMGRVSIWVSVGASGFFAAVLAYGLLCVLAEYFYGDKALRGDWPGCLLWGPPLAIWAGWALVFSRLARSGTPEGFILRQCRLLWKGSILELLVAVPTHVVARSRDYCCAGFLTFVGITFGLSIMLLSFGPGVFFLFAERWRQLHPNRFPEKPARWKDV
jgi:hypothetical protein